MSSRVYLFFPPRGHEPPPTLSDRINPHLSLKRRRFPIPRSYYCTVLYIFTSLLNTVGGGSLLTNALTTPFFPRYGTRNTYSPTAVTEIIFEGNSNTQTVVHEGYVSTRSEMAMLRAAPLVTTTVYSPYNKHLAYIHI